MKVAVTTLGCKTNQFESAAMTEKLAAEGFQLVSFDDAADIYVINTCTVTARTDAESRRLIRRAGRRNPAAKIVVTGCYAQVAHQEVGKLDGISLIIGNTEKKDIVRLLREMGDDCRTIVSDIAGESRAESLSLESFAEHTRAFLQVQNGCDAFCSYCIVPYARGRSRSVPQEEALAGIGSFTAGGFKEVVLTGIHLSCYGLDLTPPSSLIRLLREAEERKLAGRLRLGSVEPTEISDELISLIADSQMICPHLHIPLQSGNDEVLRRMNRNYSTDFFRNLIERLLNAVPDICIGLDMIAGFPGETDEQFLDGLKFVESLPIAYLHVFPFSPRPGTPAATMPGHISSSVITGRAKMLRDLSEEKKTSYSGRFIGKDLQVLVQSESGDSVQHGLSRNYLTVSFPAPASLHNQEIFVRITNESENILYGEIIQADQKTAKSDR